MSIPAKAVDRDFRACCQIRHNYYASFYMPRSWYCRHVQQRGFLHQQLLQNSLSHTRRGFGQPDRGDEDCAGADPLPDHIIEATITFVSEQDMDVASLVLGTKVGKPVSSFFVKGHLELFEIKITKAHSNSGA
jgi:hypothetical protein